MSEGTERKEWAVSGVCKLEIVLDDSKGRQDDKIGVLTKASDEREEVGSFTVALWADTVGAPKYTFAEPWRASSTTSTRAPQGASLSSFLSVS